VQLVPLADNPENKLDLRLRGAIGMLVCESVNLKGAQQRPHGLDSSTGTLARGKDRKR
jgi:hypothetical protein